MKETKQRLEEEIRVLYAEVFGVYFYPARYKANCVYHLAELVIIRNKLKEIKRVLGIR
jgi:hypothetical protein